jgi:hypothetical protein
MLISIEIKGWNQNLNVLGILIIMFETETFFFMKIKFNGQVTCNFTTMTRKWVIGEHLYVEMYELIVNPVRNNL